MKAKQVVANFKMNLNRGETKELCSYASKLSAPSDDIIILPQMPLIGATAEWLSSGSISLGSQNVSEYEKGAHTGESSAKTLKSLGCEYALIGHSERRALYKSENDKIVAKIQAAYNAGLKVILCIGEPLETYEKTETKKFLTKQLSKDVISALQLGEFYAIAYEPIWSIGTGLVPSSEEINDTLEHIKSILPESKTLYGGSVNPDNSDEILGLQNVDGVLVGSASLEWGSLSKIILSARV